MSVPPKPSAFTADGAPVGVEVKFVTFVAQRAVMTAPPRLQLVHTNAAGGEGSIESAWNWAHANPNSNTIPHYQIDRSGRARKMLPSDRVGIANCTKAPLAQVRDWSLAYETADRGTNHPDGLGGFTVEQAETLATILAYESVTHGIPLYYPQTWDGAGTASHTEPFYWSCTVGKVCPGHEKKRQLIEWVMPRAREIVAGWTAPPPPDEEDDMPKDHVIRSSNGTDEQKKAWFILGPDSIAWCRTAKQLAIGREFGWYFNTKNDADAAYTVEEIQQMISAMLVAGGAVPSGFKPPGT